MPPRPPRATLFIGVSTGGSFINRLFPVWARLMGLGEAVLEGVDLPLDVAPDRVRAVVDRIESEEQIQGALITTHKIALLQHAGDRFAELDRYAGLLGEVSAIVKRGGRLIGHAVDPITGGLALDRLAPRCHWAAWPNAGALIMGCGGAGVALAAHLLERPRDQRPARIILSDVDPARLAHGRRHLTLLDPERHMHFRQVADAADQDALLAALAPGSLVVNATGLGKDRPGSPVSDAARFPEQGLIWELNYRGPRAFLAQAEAQAVGRQLRIADGWICFVLGWAHAIALVFDLQLDDGLERRLGAAAEELRSCRSGTG